MKFKFLQVIVSSRQKLGSPTLHHLTRLPWRWVPVHLLRIGSSTAEFKALYTSRYEHLYPLYKCTHHSTTLFFFSLTHLKGTSIAERENRYNQSHTHKTDTKPKYNENRVPVISTMSCQRSFSSTICTFCFISCAQKQLQKVNIFLIRCKHNLISKQLYSKGKNIYCFMLYYPVLSVTASVHLGLFLLFNTTVIISPSYRTCVFMRLHSLKHMKLVVNSISK